ncbi:hypothetical protein [Chromobacterium sinusclupearum]|uniref:hypothetical protein n=1 Tax=Chromobacterium sinusclupearum TaxID=2077146 RepID=UPI0011AFC7A0|nr:hypothetical protein [Chromobacterium sinusclupearum]
MTKASSFNLKYFFENFDKLVLSITTFFFLVGFFCLAFFLNKLGIGLAIDLTFLPIYGAVSVMLSSILAASLMIPYFIGVSRDIIPSFKSNQLHDLSLRYFGCVVIPLCISAIIFYNGFGFGWLWALQIFLQLLYAAFLSVYFRSNFSWKSKAHLMEFSILFALFLFFSLFITVFFAIDLLYVIEILLDRQMGNIEAVYPYIFISFGFLVILYSPIFLVKSGRYNFGVIYFAVMVFFVVMVGFPDFLGQRTLRLIGTGGGIVKKYNVRMEDVGSLPLKARSMFCNDMVNCNFTISRRACLWFSSGSDLYISEISGFDAQKKFCTAPQGAVFSLGKSLLIER